MKISDSEMEIMSILWDACKPMTSSAITENLSIAWKPTTILTFLKRLECKGAITVRRENRVNYYTAQVSKEEYLHEQTTDFVSSVHDGSVSNFLAALYSDKKPTEKELAEIKEWFEKL